ncbi:putative membrane protein, partial [Acinetobacter baumannii 42057_3]
MTFLIITLINFSFGFSIPFNGAFSNPNSLGGIYAMLSFLSTGILLDKAYNSKGKKIDYYL